MQIDIANDIAFYQHVYKNATEPNLQIVNKAGHEVHYQQMGHCIDLISTWLEKMDGK